MKTLAQHVFEGPLTLPAMQIVEYSAFCTVDFSRTGFFKRFHTASVESGGRGCSPGANMTAVFADGLMLWPKHFSPKTFGRL